MNLKKYFYQEIWNIGIYQKDGNFGLTTLPTICNDTQIYWLTERFHFQADPFLVEKDDKLYVFYEALNHTWIKGQLRCRVLDKSMTELEDFALDDINALGCHLSFPQLFEVDGQYYLMPESQQTNAVYLFQAVTFPKRWQLFAQVYDQECIDSTVYFDRNQQRYWLIGSRYKSLERYILTTKNLNENWQNVPSSDFNFNIQIDNQHQRLGGAVMELAGERYLPIQQNHPVEYGKSLFIKQVYLPDLDKPTRQGESNWRETTLFEIVSQSQRYPDGIHTLNGSQNFVVIDAKRWGFQPFNFFIRKYRQLLQLFAKVSHQG